MRKGFPILLAGFAAGLVIRYLMLFYMGVSDMPSYFDWGKTTLQSGLIAAYHGIYFPLQYQLFAVNVWILSHLKYEYFVVFKASNLVFDIGSFVVLISLLRREGLNPAYSLLYWLHPWFLSMFALGYIDFQFTFFVLLSVWCLREDSAASRLLAGIPLGLAFVMKPQAMILIVAAAFYCILHLIRTRDLKPFGLLIGPVVAFGAYEAFFTASLRPIMGGRPALRVLPMSYLDITNVFPALNAQMTNLWYPIAYFMKKPEDPIFSVSDNILLMPHLPVKYLAGIVVLAVVAIQVFLVERKMESSTSARFIEIWGIATLTVPMVMTSAHENHLFLGSVFLVLLMARPYPLLFKVPAHILLLLQFTNLYGLYGEHPETIARFLRSYYSSRMATTYSVIATMCFITILGGYFYFSLKRGLIRMRFPRH
jgi:hypothetical protein